MTRTVVKICGLTREEDVAAACALGASMLGFNFVATSPRRITAERARELGSGVPSGVLKAGVFGGVATAEIARIVREAALQVAQVHRPVGADDVEGLEAEIVAAVRVEAGRAGLPPAPVLARCRAVLWDSSVGRGRRSDWTVLEGVGKLPIPTFVAGGLDPENVGEIIRRLRPQGVDVASGVESAPGIKDRRKLERFFEAVREADRA